ncbi:hypothetical protein DSM14862_04079 (plasmid) [Sulfitobacter indolifex]|uniref:Polysaccharide biosynthesis/export protein, putative n=1 Tax=Sulfitobacter indolifex HEL-45 TaxID=391624 RepID=A0ABP2D855_9RHOB|nr:polysaccharide biosynthesis/export family protein [Sulfitobacter indolifex]EDQ03416.1 polysaccharide biosynthesis/export protein, putative [Sulfitobacter indolifex HEL-45]UOA21239.1 hypothetical protein DSM14862_04079 [Sulfitobacter indolifex]
MMGCEQYLRRGASFGWRVMVMVVFLALANAAQARDYKLQPGDTLRAEIIRLNSAGWTSMIDTAGFVRFPYIGRHLAAGRSLEELQEDIVLEIVGDRVSVFNGAIETFIVLDEDSVFIDVAEYRPLTVLGAVGTPGRIDYRPGMTVRAAVGIAGDTRLPQDTDSQPDRAALLAARISELQKTEAWLLLDLWRIRGQLDEALAETPPEESGTVLESRLGSEALSNVRLQFAEARRERDLDIEDLQARIDLTEIRISYLTTALEQYEIVSAGEEERLASLLALQERGLVVANNVNEARSGALQVSSRLLQTEADLTETRRELTTLTQQLNSVDLDRRQRLLSEQAKVQRSLDETAAQLRGSRQGLIVLTGIMVDDSDGSIVEPDILLHRQEGGSVTTMPAALNDIVLPGDVIEVIMLKDISSP